MSNLFIVHHLGLGDHIICNGLYREKMRSHRRAVFVVKWANRKTIREMFADLEDLWIVPLPSTVADSIQVQLGRMLGALGWEVLRLGFYGDDFFTSGDERPFDQQFYHQANVPFDYRWSKFLLPKHIACDSPTTLARPNPYGSQVFIHEDKVRGFVIDPKYYERATKVVRASKAMGMSFFDFSYALESADEVHLIESSFLALADSISPRGKLFVHEYSRPESRRDLRHRQTLRHDWVRLEAPHP